MTDELKQWEYDRGYDKGYKDGYDKANATFELEYYQGHTLGEAYQQGRADERAELLDKVMQKHRTIITEDGVMYRVVFLKDIEDMKGEINNNEH